MRLWDERTKGGLVAIHLIMMSKTGVKLGRDWALFVGRRYERTASGK